MNITSIIVGFLTGVAASMGLGGGFILIIWLTMFADVSQKAAGGINLLFFIPIALVSIIIHTKNKLIDWKILPLILLIGIMGALLGVFLATLLEEAILQKSFAVLLIFVGVKEMLRPKKAL